MERRDADARFPHHLACVSLSRCIIRSPHLISHPQPHTRTQAHEQRRATLCAGDPDWNLSPSLVLPILKAHQPRAVERETGRRNPGQRTLPPVSFPHSVSQPQRRLPVQGILVSRSTGITSIVRRLIMLFVAQQVDWSLCLTWKSSA